MASYLLILGAMAIAWSSYSNIASSYSTTKNRFYCQGVEQRLIDCNGNYYRHSCGNAGVRCSFETGNILQTYIAVVTIEHITNSIAQ